MGRRGAHTAGSSGETPLAGAGVMKTLPHRSRTREHLLHSTAAKKEFDGDALTWRQFVVIFDDNS